MDEQPKNTDARRRRPFEQPQSMVVKPDSMEQVIESIQPEQAAKPKRRPEPRANTRDEFTQPAAPLQVKLPQDLIQSLKLHSIGSNKTMSDLVLECLTTQAMVSKAWISTRRADGTGNKAA